MTEGIAPKTAGVAADKDPALLNLIKSSLCDEDVHGHGHHTVWGSWYDVEAKSWGYACCHGLKKEDQCTASRQEKRKANKFLLDERPFDWGKPPLELLPREKVTLTASLLNSKDNHQGCYVAFFFRYVFGAWRRMLGGQMSGEGSLQDWHCPDCRELNFARKTTCRKCGAANPATPANTESDNHVVVIERAVKFEGVDHFTHREKARIKKDPQIVNVMPSDFPADLKGVQIIQETERGLVPLMRQLQASKADQGFVDHLDKVISQAALQEYVEASKAFTEMSAAKSNDYDDATLQKVLQAVKNIVRLAEALHPSLDAANKFAS